MLENEIKNHQESKDVTDRARSSDVDSYNFNNATVILSIQILPSPEATLRTALLAIGIKGEAPITITTTLEDLTRSPTISQSLEQLKQALPQIVRAAKNRTNEQLNQKFSQRSLSLPNPSPAVSSSDRAPSNQLSLF